MHRKPFFVLAGVFLAIALIVPPVILLIQSDQDLDNYITARNDPGMATAGNATFIQEINEGHQTNFLIVVVFEAVFLPLFLVTIYYGIKHTHPEH